MVVLQNTENFISTEYSKEKIIDRKSTLTYHAFNSKIPMYYQKEI